MAVEVVKSWMIDGPGLAALGMLLGWDWSDGGARPISALAEPAVLQPVGR